MRRLFDLIIALLAHFSAFASLERALFADEFSDVTER